MTTPDPTSPTGDAPETPRPASAQPQSYDPKLVAKLHNVFTAVERIPKRGFNERQGYWYLKESDLKEEVAKLLGENGIMPLPLVSGHHSERLSDKQHITTIDLVYRFVDIETGHSIDLPVFGTGADTGDKAAPKALTQAIKMALSATFLVPTGDDPEDDGSDTPPAGDSKQGKPTAKQAKQDRDDSPADKAREEAVAENSRLYKLVAKNCGITKNSDPNLDDFHAALVKMCGVTDLKTADPFLVRKKINILKGLEPRGVYQLIKQNRAQNPAPKPVTKKREAKEHAA